MYVISIYVLFNHNYPKTNTVIYHSKKSLFCLSTNSICMYIKRKRKKCETKTKFLTEDTKDGE